jgi:hypothetical protein
MAYPDIVAAAAAGGVATTVGTIAAAIDDGRRLGLLDLLLTPPGIGGGAWAISSRRRLNYLGVGEGMSDQL